MALALQHGASSSPSRCSACYLACTDRSDLFSKQMLNCDVPCNLTQSVGAVGAAAQQAEHHRGDIDADGVRAAGGAHSAARAAEARARRRILRHHSA